MKKIKHKAAMAAAIVGVLPIVAQRDGGAVTGGAELAIGCEYSRSVPITREKVGDGYRYAATLSSEAPAMQPFGLEILDHGAGAINLERAAHNGLPLLFDHQTSCVIGRALDITLGADRKLHAGDMKFSQRADAQGYRQDIDDGILGEVSIRYTIDDYAREETPEGEIQWRIMKWTPVEVSIVPIPADHTVGVGRAMAMRNKPPGTPPAGEPGTTDTAAWSATRAAAAAEGATGATAAENARTLAIREMFNRYDGAEYRALMQHCIEKRSTEAQAAMALLALRDTDTGRQAPAGTHVDQRMGDEGRRSFDTRIAAGRAQIDKLNEAAQFAVGVRTSIITPKNDPKFRELAAGNPYMHYSFRELAREYLREWGMDDRGLSPEQVIKYAMRPDYYGGRRDLFNGHGSSDFTALLENNANKALMLGFTQTNETWPSIVRTGSLPDFKAGTRVGLGAVSSLAVVKPNGEYTYATVNDVKELIQLEKRGVIFAITWEAVQNDDLDAMVRIPMLMGAAANRSVGDAVYALFTANGTMNEDGLAWFEAGTHKNIASAGAPSVARLNEGDKLMAVQKSPGNYESGGLNIQLAKLIVPRALKSTAQVLAAAQFDPASATLSQTAPNIWQNNFEVVSDARLDAASASVYYASADPNLVDTVEVAFLNGMQEPYLESRDGWSVDGTEWKIRHVFAAAKVGWRGVVRFPG